jgi:DNA-binding LacI/PurR family transcriptional regulator
MDTVFGTPSCREELALILRRRIAEGALPSGAPLPGERELAELTGLARGTVRSALDLLQDEGLIICAHGRRRTVAKQRSQVRILAVVAVDPTPRPDLWRWPGLDAWLQLGMAQAAYARGWSVLSLHPGAVAAGLGPLPPMSGLLLSTTAFEAEGVPELIVQAQREGLPICGLADDPALVDCDRAVHDHAAGCALLVEALLQRGVRRIWPCWGHRAHLDPWYLRARRRGLEEVLQRAGLPIARPPWHLVAQREDDDPCWSVLVEQQAAELAPLFANENEAPEALLAVNDLHAWRIAAALRQIGLPPARWPLITGYDGIGRFGVPDDEPDWEPDLSIDRGNERIAAQAVGLLIARLDGALPPGPQLQLVPPARLLHKTWVS